MPCASYQCTSALRIFPLLNRTSATPLSLRQRPVPYSLRSRGRSRMRLPAAIVSTCEISLTISKGIRRHYDSAPERRRAPFLTATLDRGAHPVGTRRRTRPVSGAPIGGPSTGVVSRAASAPPRGRGGGLDPSRPETPDLLEVKRPLV